MDARIKDLHALHVASLGGDGTTMAPPMQLALDANFGSIQRWREAFAAMGQALAGGRGWVLLSFRPSDATLVNQCGADPDTLDAGLPILALHVNPPSDPPGAVDTFMAHIDWAAVYRRYQAAVQAASEPFIATAADLDGATLLDVRRDAVFRQATTMLPGARWRNPAQVADWAGELPTDRPVVAYCVHGEEVGRATVLRLRAAGIDARFLGGGIAGWEAAGRPLADKPAGPVA